MRLQQPLQMMGPICCDSGGRLHLEVFPGDVSWRWFLKDKKKIRRRSFQALKKNVIKAELQVPQSPWFISIPTLNGSSSVLHQGFPAPQTGLHSFSIFCLPPIPHLDSPLTIPYRDSVFQPNLNNPHHIASLLGKLFIPSLSIEVLLTIRLCEAFLNPPGKINGTFFYAILSYNTCHSHTYIRHSYVLVHLPHQTINSLRTRIISYLSVPLWWCLTQSFHVSDSSLSPSELNWKMVTEWKKNT